MLSSSEPGYRDVYTHHCRCHRCSTAQSTYRVVQAALPVSLLSGPHIQSQLRATQGFEMLAITCTFHLCVSCLSSWPSSRQPWSCSALSQEFPRNRTIGDPIHNGLSLQTAFLGRNPVLYGSDLTLGGLMPYTSALFRWVILICTRSSCSAITNIILQGQTFFPQVCTPFF